MTSKENPSWEMREEAFEKMPADQPHYNAGAAVEASCLPVFSYRKTGQPSLKASTLAKQDTLLMVLC